MSANDVNAQSGNAVEPLLPIEKKLIGYSLSLGIVLLVILVVLNHLYPAQL
ncbi:conserved hypothetical protein [Bradyrhizobium sp. STM 3843]|uniref:hypothetical protein n=1 Tax=Bradyrhizobium sp. STM 3843 TaxID=551947 RepID=UPI0002406C0E|nr:hypothetical protein [Bradyrhizobium sp. STM 3843]CCE06176.1 conserved hypothetical protein [Bradyrhizobium sp. STM 3843]